MPMLTAEQLLSLLENVADGTGKPGRNDNVQRSFAVEDELLGNYNLPRLIQLNLPAPNMSQIVEDEKLDRKFRDQISRRMKLTKT